MLDTTRKVQTRNGRAVKIISWDGGSTEYPIVGLIDGEIQASSWPRSGRIKYNNHKYDLVNVPERIKRVVWVNIYDTWASGCHITKANADSNSCDGRLACVQIEIECNVGAGL